VKPRARRLTPLGVGAIQVIQLCGDGVEAFLDAHFVAAGRRGCDLPFGHLRDGDEVLDEVLVVRGAGESPHELELHVHGGLAVERRLRCLLESKGFQWGEEKGAPALAGLTATSRRDTAIQREVAEAFPRALATQSSLFLASILGGRLSRTLEGLIGRLEHPTLASRMGYVGVTSTLESLLQRAPFGLGLFHPPRVVLVGPVNAGKSTLLNRLAGKERVLATPEPGTTRDAVAVEVELAGFPFVLVDTAGRRETDDPVELLGLARAAKEEGRSNLVLRLETPTTVREAAVVSPDELAVVSFADTLSRRERARLEGMGRIVVSGTTGEGVDILIGRMIQATSHGLPATRDVVVPFTTRQVDLLEQALRSLPENPAGAVGALEEILSGPS